MRLPSTSAAQTFLMDPSREYVLFNQFAYPALQVQSVLNRANATAIIQATGTNQPVWSMAQLQGTYSFRNEPGYPGVAGVNPGSPGLLFSGAQFLEYDALASAYATPESPVTVVAVVTSAAAGGTVWSFADASDGYALSLSYSSGSFRLTETNLNGTFSATAVVTHDTLHVVTAARAGGNLLLRVDGVAGSPVAVTAGTVVPTTFVVGALNSGGSVSSQFHGSLGPVAVYTGAADVFSVETFLLQEYGIIRGATSGTNSGF